MKQVLFTLILASVSCLRAVYGQIPNGGFEDWELVQNFEKPVGWNTNQDSNFIRFEKDTLRVEGNYSLKFVPSTYSAFFECSSFAYKRTSLNGPVGENKSLTFFLRSVPDTLNPWETAYFQIKCAFYESGIFSSKYEWYTFEVIDEFTKMEIPIANSSVDSIGIFMYGGASNGATDGCHNTSFSWVDGMKIETSTSAGISPNLGNQLEVWPNPVQDILYLQHPSSPTPAPSTLYLFDILGREVLHFSLAPGQSQIDLGGLPNGVYMVTLENAKRQVIGLERVVVGR